jgi:hypothetical protein
MFVVPSDNLRFTEGKRESHRASQKVILTVRERGSTSQIWRLVRIFIRLMLLKHQIYPLNTINLLKEEFFLFLRI